MTPTESRPDDLRVLVAVPTYNERENLPGVLARLRTAVPSAHVLVADDDSPDGTGQAAAEAATRDAGVHVLHRPGKQGLGAAYLDGFGWGLARGYDVLVEMDADGSHSPSSCPRCWSGSRTGPTSCWALAGSRADRW